MEEMVKTVEKFIEDNKLDFSGSGSELNGNCVTLAGFICYVLDSDPKLNTTTTGIDIIDELDIDADANLELNRVFAFAWSNSYERFWKTSAAEAQYTF